MIINGHTLEEGEVLCPKCKGIGRREITTYVPEFICSKCGGQGYLDWVEMIVGKNPFDIWYSSNNIKIQSWLRADYGITKDKSHKIIRWKSVY